MEKEGIIEKIFDRVIAFTGHKDIDFEMYPDFQKISCDWRRTKIRSFFTEGHQFLRISKFIIWKVMVRFNNL